MLEDTEDDLEADGVWLSCCNRRSNGEGRRLVSIHASGFFRFLDGTLFCKEISLDLASVRTTLVS